MKLSEIYTKYGEFFDRSSLPYLHCNSCDHRFYYPRDRCPKCHSEKLQVKVSSGKGRIFSYTIVHRKGMNDICYAIVEMEEGFRMYCNVIGPAEIDQHVRVIFKERDGSKIPLFAPS